VALDEAPRFLLGELDELLAGDVALEAAAAVEDGHPLGA